MVSKFWNDLKFRYTLNEMRNFSITKMQFLKGLSKIRLRRIFHYYIEIKTFNLANNKR